MPENIDNSISACEFHEAKAIQVHEITLPFMMDNVGALSCKADASLSFRGAGLECANLVLGVIYNETRIE
jgi:endonuclease III